jgi:FlaA1/EpsC-like NDP-sugar epimerase
MKSEIRNKALLILLDTILISLSVFLAFLFRFDGLIPEHYFPSIIIAIFLFLITTIPIFYFLKLYHFIWSYVSTEELLSLSKALGLVFLISNTILFLFRDSIISSSFPRSIIFISVFYIFLFCGALRLSKRIYLNLFKIKKTKENVLIVGTKDIAEQIFRSISSKPYSVIGFIENDLSRKNKIIHGLKVLGTIKEIPKIAQERIIDTVIIAIDSSDKNERKEAIKKSKEAGIKKIKTTPSIEDIIDSNLIFGKLKEFKISNLLNRKQEVLNKKEILSLIKDRKVLVTGAAGSIGSELSRQISKLNPKNLILVDRDETGIFNISRELKSSSFVADITDRKRMEKIFDETNPEIVFHAAAYKHLSLMENNPVEAVKNNIFGTEILGEISIKKNVDKFILISTDKAVNPISVMGQTKRIAEMISVLFNNQNKTKFISVRFGNVLDSRGNVVSIFKEKIEKKEEIEITHPEMKRFFMTTEEACLLVLESASIGIGGEIFILDMGEPIKIIDLAKKMIILSGLEPEKDIPIIFTKPKEGEKIEESLLSEKEKPVKTRNKKIFKLTSEKINSSLLSELEKIRNYENIEENKLKIILERMSRNNQP